MFYYGFLFCIGFVAVCLIAVLISTLVRRSYKEGYSNGLSDGLEWDAHLAKRE